MWIRFAETESVEDNSLLSIVILIGDLVVVVEVEAFKKLELIDCVLVPEELESLTSDVILFKSSSFWPTLMRFWLD